MNDMDPTGGSGKALSPDSLFLNYERPSNAWRESDSSEGALRVEWRNLFNAFDRLGVETLTRREKRIRRMRNEDWASFNPFHDQDGDRERWSLDILPMTISAVEWEELEAGVIQRATLLESVLRDVYGPQRLLQDGRLPASLVHGNPGFIHACHGIQPSDGRYLPLYAADLYRDEEGRFRVLRDHGGMPTGLGIALENRLLISRAFPEIYRQSGIRRLAPFFQRFQNEMARRTGQPNGDPAIVLLTTGPDRENYHGHTLLARYLGIPLVESQDMTVRNGDVYLKKLEGLEKVDAIFRQIPDRESDPFTLGSRTRSGVAGLIQASREGNVELINPIGSGWVDSAALGARLSDLSVSLLGSPLALPSHPAWWCGDESGRSHVTQQADRLTLQPAMGPIGSTFPKGALDEVRVPLYERLGRTQPIASAVPSWSEGKVRSTHALLRVFVCAVEEGFAVLPGGLALCSDRMERLLATDPSRLRTRDVWVVSNRAEERVSMLSRLEISQPLRRSGDLPSRVADNLFWLGRYLERAEYRIRILRTTLQRLSGESTPEEIQELPFLLELLRDQGMIPTEENAESKESDLSNLGDRLEEALYGADQPESVAHSLRQVWLAARNVRDRLSQDSWGAINRLEEYSGSRDGDSLSRLNDMLITLHAFSGLTMEGITRSLGWRFLDMGRRLERGKFKSGLVRIALSGHSEHRSSLYAALLEVSDSIMTYRSRYRTTFQLEPVLDLLLADETNPKSLAFQLAKLSAHLENLPRQQERPFTSVEEKLALEMLTRIRLLDLSWRDREGEDASALLEFLTNIDQGLEGVARQIAVHYLSRVPSTQHYSVSLSR